MSRGNSYPDAGKDRLVLSLREKIIEQAAEIENLNESLMIAYVDGVYEGRKSKDAEIERFKTAIQQCLTDNARLADGDNCGLAGPKQAMKE